MSHYALYLTEHMTFASLAAYLKVEVNNIIYDNLCS